jgi:hypothetical protein
MDNCLPLPSNGDAISLSSCLGAVGREGVEGIFNEIVAPNEFFCFINNSSLLFQGKLAFSI